MALNHLGSALRDEPPACRQAGAASPKLRDLTLRGVPILSITARRGRELPLQGGTAPLTDDRSWPILALLMKAEIISIGTEILLAELLDTNANYLAARLPALGVDLYWMTQVGDNLDRLTEAFRRAWDRSDLTLAPGGPGPTGDDVSRAPLAAAP